MNFNFPKALTALPNWVCWRLEKVKGRDCKVPYNAKTGGKAMPNNPETWATFDEAVAAMQKYGFLGVGFMFTLESGIVGINLDKCFDENGNPNEIAKAILDRVGTSTYTELSPSRTGLHIFLKGTLPKGGRRNSKNGVEIYSEKRYFTMTGMQYSNCVEIADDTGSLAWIHDTFIKPPKKQSKSRNNTVPKGTSCLEDDELIKMATKSKDTDFAPLWNGSWQGMYKSQSEADMALCGKIAWWANADCLQTDRLFRQSGLMREKWTGDYASETVRIACDNIVEGFTRATKKSAPRQDKEVTIFEQNGGYYLQRGNNVKQLTTYYIVPVGIVVTDEETLYTCDFVTPKKTYRLTLLAEDFSELKRYRRATTRKTLALGFLGTGGDLEIFKTFVEELEWKEKLGVKTLGTYNHNDELVFVTTSKAVKARNISVDTIIQLEKHQKIKTSILDGKKFLNAKTFQQLGSMILGYNEYAKTVSILAWTAGCFIKHHLRESETKYPHLFMVGIPGSGKSATLEFIITVIFSCFSIKAANQTSRFSLMDVSASSNLMPQFINEFKPATLDSKVLKDLLNHFRDSYDRHEGERGTPKLELNTYELLAPILVAGEASPSEAAIRERTIELLFSPHEIEENLDFQNTFEALVENRKLLESFGRTLLDVALLTTPDEANDWYKEGFERVKGNFPSRVTKNLACVYAGLKLIERVCVFFELSWLQVFPISFDECVNHLIYAVREYLLDGGNHSKNVIEEAFEIMARMGLKYDKDYLIENSGKHLCLKLPRIYDDYTKYRMNHAILGEVLTEPEFRRQLKNSPYIVNKKKPSDHRYFNGNRERAWIIDFEKLQSVCDVEGFLKQPPEPKKD